MSNKERKFRLLHNLEIDGYYDDCEKIFESETFHLKCKYSNYDDQEFHIEAGTILTFEELEIILFTKDIQYDLKLFQEITARTKAEEILNILNISYNKPHTDIWMHPNTGRKKYILWTCFADDEYIKITESQYKALKRLEEEEND